jgi:hypothetical protein
MAMKLKSTREAEELNQKNLSRIRSLIARFEDPECPAEERARIKETFQKIIDHADKVQKQDSLFFRMAKKVSGNGHKGE